MKRMLSNLNATLALILAFVLVQLVNFIALRNPVRLDVSSRKYYELSDKTKHLLKSLDRPVDVYVIFSREHVLRGDIDRLLEEYRYLSRNVRVEKIDPSRDMARTEQLAKKYGLTEPNVVVFDMDGRSRTVHQADLANYRMVKGRKEPVLSAFKGEQVFSGAIRALEQGETPKIYFLAGHGERHLSDFNPLTGYSHVGEAIVRDNIDVEELMLTKDKGIPKDAACLVIAGPTKPMSADEVEMIGDYLDAGGRLLVMLDALMDTGAESLLRRWGVALRRDFVLDPLNTVKGSDVYVKTYYEHPITLHMGQVGARFYLPRSVEPVTPAETETKKGEGEDRPMVTRLAVTSKRSWSEMQVSDANAKYDEGTGDRRGPVCLAVAVERGAPEKMLDMQIRPTRMVVFGDSDFVANDLLTGGNQDLFMSALSWLLERDTQMSIDPKPIEEVKISLSRRQLRRLFWVGVGGIPSLAILWGVLVWSRRRK